MKAAPVAGIPGHNKIVAAKKPATPAIECHDTSMKMAGSM
jgi:hypothetical protein